MSHLILVENDGGLIELDLPGFSPVVYVPVPPKFDGFLPSSVALDTPRTVVRRFVPFRASTDGRWATYVEE